jgi:hypothetical protein
LFANLPVVDGRIVTGQKQNVGSETANRMMAALEGVELEIMTTEAGVEF